MTQKKIIPKNMIDFILRVFLFIHGLWLCRIGVLWIKNPRIEVFEYLLKKKGLDGPGFDIMVPFLGKSFFTAGILGPGSCTSD